MPHQSDVPAYLRVITRIEDTLGLSLEEMFTPWAPSDRADHLDIQTLKQRARTYRTRLSIIGSWTVQDPFSLSSRIRDRAQHGLIADPEETKTKASSAENVYLLLLAKDLLPGTIV